MAISLKHAFTSAKADGPDPSLIQPSYWNAQHIISMATARLLGRFTGGDGSAEELTVGNGIKLEGGMLQVAPGVGVTVEGGLVTSPSISVGTVCDYAGATAPTRWLLCYGQAISRVTYLELFTALSTIYGIGNGTTTFNVPDCRGRVIAGQDDMGGISADRMTLNAGGINADNLGDTGGTETRALTVAQMPAHTHSGSTSSSGYHGHPVRISVSNQTSAYSNTSGGFLLNIQDVATYTNTYNASNTAGDQIGGAGSHTHAVTLNNTGSGSEFSLVQPTIVLNKIIYTGVV